ARQRPHRDGGRTTLGGDYRLPAEAPGRRRRARPAAAGPGGAAGPLRGRRGGRRPRPAPARRRLAAGGAVRPPGRRGAPAAPRNRPRPALNGPREGPSWAWTTTHSAARGTRGASSRRSTTSASP